MAETHPVAQVQDEPVLALVKAQQEHQALQEYHYDQTVIDYAVMTGDLAKLEPQQRLQFYRAVCLSAGLNPLTQPFTMLKRQDGTHWLYANSTCTQQLAKLHRVSFRDTRRIHETILGEPIYRVEMLASTPDGRIIEGQGVISLTKKKKVQQGVWKNSGDPKWIDALDEDGEPILVPLRGEALANAIMKCDTKAQRRAVLALVGLGWMSTEYDGRTVGLDTQTGEIIDAEATTVPAIPLTQRPEEQGKSVQEHIDDLFDTGTHSGPTLADAARRLPLGMAIDRILRAMEVSPAKADEFWLSTQRKYPDITPGVLSMLHEQIVARQTALMTQQQAPPVVHEREPGEEEEEREVVYDANQRNLWDEEGDEA